MRFGPTRLDDAEGAILAHTTRVAGRVLKKGARLDPAALDLLRAAGIGAVVTARLQPGDVGEDEAARRLGTAFASTGLAATREATGRVNLIAREAGLLRVSAARIAAVNAIDESVTIATLPDAVKVSEGEIVATVKIIPFAVAAEVLRRAERAATAPPAGETGPALHLLPWRPLRAGLVLTRLSHLKQSAIDATIAATRSRVESFGGQLMPPRECAHDAEAVAAALADLLQDGAELLLVAGASAVVDRADIGPAAIVRAGGAIAHFGMPVDPGNLICVGAIGAVPALVLPGCARSPRPNGIDRVLQLLCAGLPCSGADIAGMGVGGLLKESSARPLRRARASRAGPQVAAIVLAAGRSARMAPRHKLLIAGPDGRPMIARVVDEVLASPAQPVLVVTGHRAEEVRAALAGRRVLFVTAAGYAEGIATSLRAGLAALPDSAAAALIVLGDMPLVTADMLGRLIAAYDPDEGRTIVAAAHAGAIGNPVLWDRRFFAEMRALTGDRGARPLLARHAESVMELELGEAAIRDFDTPESLTGESLTGLVA